MTFAPELSIHNATRKQLEAFLAHPAHALILHGIRGVGFTAIAMQLARQLTREPVRIVAPVEGKDITIEQIRELYTSTRAISADGQAVIIDEANRMSLAAQNALLKLLEEPPRHVYFIITSHDVRGLLPTIQSRARLIAVHGLNMQQSRELVEARTTDTVTQSQVLFLAHGRPAYMSRLLDDPDIFARDAAMARDAREFVQTDTYHRLIICSRYMTDRAVATSFVTMLGNVVYHMLKKQPDAVTHHSPDSISEALDNLHVNANVRLEMTHVALSF